ncbi:MAG: hypothetical protein ACLRXC_06260 [[Clostridium] leptum]
MDIEKAIEAEWNLLVGVCGDFLQKIKIAERGEGGSVRLAVAANRDEVKATLKGLAFCSAERDSLSGGLKKIIPAGGEAFSCAYIQRAVG